MTDLPPVPTVTLTDHPLIDNVPLASPNGTAPAKPSSATPTAAAVDPNEVRLVVNGVSKTGWLEVMITRGIEIMPSNFAISLTDLYSGDSAQTPLKKGDQCQVFIGDDLVLTGVIDRVRRRIAQDGTTLVIIGRSLCRDLVDCCVDPAQVPNMQISQSSAADVVTKLAATYKIKTNVLGNVGANIINQFNVNLGELVFPIIDRIARASQFLAYDERDGSLNLAPVGAGAMASGITEGVNIEPGATYEEGVDQRYSDYEVYYTSTFTLSDIAPLPALQLIKDPTITQFRKLIVFSDQNQLDPSLAQKRGRLGNGEAVWSIDRADADHR